MKNQKRKTKIVATIGPASNSYEKLVELYESGVNVFRLNFSHGRHDDHEQVIKHIVKLNEVYNAHVSILADLQGPKLRTGLMQNNAIELMEGESIKVTCNDVIGTKDLISVTYEFLAKDLKIGESILIDDGKLELQVAEIISEKMIRCRVISGGTLSSKKGFNLPDTRISLPSLTEKDRADLAFILTQPVNWIALSFVRTDKEIYELKDIIQQHQSHLKVVAKIEKPEAVANIDSIIKATDAVMVARGDLGVEVAMEEMPLIQKNIILKCCYRSIILLLSSVLMHLFVFVLMPLLFRCKFILSNL